VPSLLDQSACSVTNDPSPEMRDAEMQQDIKPAVDQSGLDSQKFRRVWRCLASGYEAIADGNCRVSMEGCRGGMNPGPPCFGPCFAFFSTTLPLDRINTVTGELGVVGNAKTERNIWAVIGVRIQTAFAGGP
jgi:hypothetical protein